MKQPCEQIGGMGRGQVFKVRYNYLPRNLPRAGEVTMKQFFLETAEKFGVRPGTVAMWHSRGKIAGIAVRSVNQRVKFVRVTDLQVKSKWELVGSGEIRLRDWALAAAARLGISFHAAEMRFYRGTLDHPPVRREGKYVFMKA